MVAYALVIIDGGLHERSMTVVIGDTKIHLDCGTVRQFIRQANEVGIDAALEHVCPEGRTVMKTVYEEFKGEIDE